MKTKERKLNEIQGRLLQLVFEERKIHVYLPPDYSLDDKPFSVAYLHDGDTFLRAGEQRGILELEQGILKGIHRGMIFVGIEPKDRLNEYTPWYGKALSKRFKDFGGGGDQYLDMIVNRLKPFIDQQYHTIRGPEGTGILGASLGGMISLYAGTLYPEVFGKIGSFSGSLWYAGFIEYMERASLSPRETKIYLDVGSLEGVGKESVQVKIVPNTKGLFELFKRKGCSDQQIKLLIEEGALHDYRYFVKRFPMGVCWLFAREIDY